MANKKVITTRQEIEEPPDGEITETEPEELDAASQELADYLESLGTSANRIKIYKVMDNGEKGYCGSAEPSVVNEDYLLRAYRGGRYMLMATMNGRYVKGGTRQITIYEPPVEPGELRAKDNENSSMNQFQMMQAEINRMNSLVLELIKGRQTDQPSLSDIVSIVRDMNAMTKQPDITALLPNVMSVFKDTMALARETAGDGGKTDWLGLATKAMDKLPAIVGQIAGARAMEARNATLQNPPAQGAESEEDMNAEIAIKAGIGWLKAKAMAGKDPELQIAFILDNFDNPQFYALGQNLLSQDFESFGKYDPEILKEPLRSWFLKVYNGLKQAIEEDSENEPDNTIAGTNGSGADPEGNETSND
jgi:hypothetical protein